MPVTWLCVCVESGGWPRCCDMILGLAKQPSPSMLAAAAAAAAARPHITGVIDDLLAWSPTLYFNPTSFRGRNLWKNAIILKTNRLLLIFISVNFMNMNVF